jgi:hypothetical protein
MVAQASKVDRLSIKSGRPHTIMLRTFRTIREERRRSGRSILAKCQKAAEKHDSRYYEQRGEFFWFLIFDGC